MVWGCFCRKPKGDARNAIDIKWIIKWKLVDGERIIKLRMTVRGFKDRAESLETYSGTASMQDQRLVDSVSVLDPEFEIFSMDVGKAFAKGMTFAELSELTGQPMRHVEFQLIGEDLEI